MKSGRILILLMILMIATGIQAQDFYLGAGIGNSFIATEIDVVQEEAKKLDENATGYKFFAGLTTPTIIGVEGGYRNFGTLTFSEYEFETKMTGWDVYAMGRFEILAIVDVFAKAGAVFWKTESILLESTIDKSGTDFAWGLGAGVHLGPIGVRLEWENFVVEKPLTISMLSLSATYGF
jgi:opacity protein-like surface antigen